MTGTEEILHPQILALGITQNPVSWLHFESRLLYVAKFEEAVYVLHCFQKKTPATTKHDKEIAEARYRAVVRERKTTK